MPAKVRIQKANKKRPATQKALAKREAFLRKAEKAVKISFVDGITKFKSRISHDKLAQMYHAKDYTALDEHISWDDIGKHMKGTQSAIGEAFDTSFKHAVNAIQANEVDPKYVHNVTGRAAQAKLRTRQRDYLQDLKSNRANIHKMIAEGHSLGRTPKAVALAIKSQIALTDVQQGAIDKLQKKLEKQGLSPSAIKRRVEAKERQSLNYRANTIAITETRVAAAAAETAVWQQQQKDGLLPAGAVKVWSAEPDACDEICRPMDGVAVPIDETWTLPDGRGVSFVNESHPRCRCTAYIEDGE